MKRIALLGACLAALVGGSSVVQAGFTVGDLVNCCHGFKSYMRSVDNYYIVPPMRPHAAKLPLRPRVEYAPTIVPRAPVSALESRAPAYTRPPATVYGPAVAAPGPGVPIYGPHDTAIDPGDPFGTVFPVYPPAHGSGRPGCSVFHK